MNPYLKMLENPKMTLIMSLPKNDPALCRAAFEAGADAVKVHINVEHRASGSRFGRLCTTENERTDKIVGSGCQGIP